MHRHVTGYIPCIDDWLQNNSEALAAGQYAYSAEGTVVFICILPFCISLKCFKRDKKNVKKVCIFGQKFKKSLYITTL